MKKKHIANVIFLGSLWGILEVSLGYVLHFIPGIAGFFMFPIAVMILNTVYKQTKSLNSLLYTGIITASIKLTNLFLPYNSINSIIHPALAIVLESIAVIFVFKLIKRESLDVLQSFLMSFIWRFAFVVILTITKMMGANGGLVNKPIPTIIQFLLLDSIINAFIISFLSKYFKVLKLNFPKFSPFTQFILSFMSFAIAVSINSIFSQLK